MGMKRRIIKKNINRYITPYIRNLPRITCRVIEVQENRDGEIYSKYIGNNHTIANGKVATEGERYFKCDNLSLNIRRTGETVKYILDNFKDVYVRIEPEVRGNHIRIRIITE